ncbi:MAG: zf-HC2 domain-containing protein [Thermotogae bacterium]|nr:zf-HC2 domain-containing protein [Thermotogota bacterium]
MKESCEELCMKYLDGEMTEEEEYHFKKHVESCDFCQDFLKNYQIFISVEKIRTSYHPSISNKKKVMKKIRNKKFLPYRIALATVSVFFGVFLLQSYFNTSSTQNYYAKIFEKGVEMLSQSTSTYVENSVDNLLEKIKLVNDSF